MAFNYDDIDLYYYHSTDIDITRLYSIINNGILCASEASKLPYYHRNYINSSCKNDYISVSHFSRTIWHHFHIKNELYENNRNKIVFILNGDIDALDKQFYKRKYEYTTERHVKSKISREDIVGIVVRKNDIDKSLNEIPFLLNYTNWNDVIKKCFDVINYLNDIYGYNKNIDEFYIMIGKLVEYKVMKDDSYNILIKLISEYMKNYIYEAYKNILGIDNPTLYDLLMLYKDKIDIYVMTKYDIQPINNMDNLITNAKEKYEDTYPNREYPKISREEKERLVREEKINIEEQKLLGNMCESDLKIYLDNYYGPLTLEGNNIKNKILELKK